jgi:pimeloyl-ACP methyl ester carboxylesterase
MTATVLLIHGAFADGSAWNKVLAGLQQEGIEARAVANPLRGLTADGDYVASVAAQTEGDVVLVGHSYGGAVATCCDGIGANPGQRMRNMRMSLPIGRLLTFPNLRAVRRRRRDHSA